MTRVKVLQGRWPGPDMGLMLADGKSCYARFVEDPHNQIWVCSRLGDRVFGVPLSRDQEWVAIR